ncbi:MAG TPA: hypothetical protein GXX75_03950 [Clostridiales bacterium]|nr:hypothetical protein [Clostridiales bacterium]
MGLEGISSVTQSYGTNATAKAKESEAKVKTGQQEKEGDAAVYEKNETAAPKNKIYQRDDDTVSRLLAEAEKRSQSLRDLVEKMLLKQGETFTEATDMYALLREGKLQVDPETQAQAKKDIAEDGYWGVDQTSERLVSFAKALTGGDPSKAEEMIAAVKKGFKAAEKAWGGELPEISKKTLDAAIKKLEAWRDGTDSTSK